MIIVRPPPAAGDHQHPPQEWPQHSRVALSKPGEENIKICIKTDEDETFITEPDQATQAGAPGAQDPDGREKQPGWAEAAGKLLR